MSYSSLLVHVDVDGEIGGRVRLAAGLADQFHSHLIGAASWMARPPFVVEGVTIDPEPTDEDYKEMREVLGRRGKEFVASVGTDKRKVEWRSSIDFPNEFVAREARAADLVIIGRDRKFQDPYRSTDCGALVLRTGRPVLAVPPGIQSLRPADATVSRPRFSSGASPSTSRPAGRPRRPPGTASWRKFPFA